MKVTSGLTPFGESVWPGVHNDLYVAHSSIYHFFAEHTTSKRVLDAGCGAGYGSFFLAENGATSVLGVDVDRRNIKFASRKYCLPQLRFEVADLEELDLPPDSVDIIVSSNVLEHLNDPGKVLTAAKTWLTQNGTFIIALPPILGEADAEAHSHIHYHRTNLTVDEWLELFESSGWDARLLAHRTARPDLELDFTSPFRSRAKPSDFVCVASDRDDVYRDQPITAVFMLSPTNATS
jgi:SAM-dependent methyltransferase